MLTSLSRRKVSDIYKIHRCSGDITCSCWTEAYGRTENASMLLYHNHGAREQYVVSYIAAAVLTVYTVVAQTDSFLWCREWLEQKLFC